MLARRHRDRLERARPLLDRRTVPVDRRSPSGKKLFVQS
jgi:hypothetical protein